MNVSRSLVGRLWGSSDWSGWSDAPGCGSTWAILVDCPTQL